MATLLIRNVDPALHARLKARAAAHHRSLQEEARTLLRTGLARGETGEPGDAGHPPVRTGARRRSGTAAA